jgi:hypothetical protein
MYFDFTRERWGNAIFIFMREIDMAGQLQQVLML